MPYDRTAFITRTPLEGVAFDFMVNQDGFLADKLFTPKPVDRAEKKVAQFDTSKLRSYDDAKGTNAEASKIDEQLFYRNIALQEYKLGSDINPRSVRDADMPGLIDDARKVKIVTQALLIRRELRAATVATLSTNYPTALYQAIASGSRWNEGLGNPESDMAVANEALRNSCGREANAVSMDVGTFDKIKLSPAFIDRTKYVGAGPVTKDQMKSFFGESVEYLFIGRGRYDSSNEGVAASVGAIWGATVIAHVYEPSSSMESQGYGSMYLYGAPFWTASNPDLKRVGPAGPMRTVEVGTEYVLLSGMTPASGDTDFAAGYLFATAVA